MEPIDSAARAERQSVVYRTQAASPRRATGEADRVTTEVIRSGLNATAEQMKRALIRTAFSPVIYEMIDFAVRHLRPRACACSRRPRRCPPGSGR